MSDLVPDIRPDEALLRRWADESGNRAVRAKAVLLIADGVANAEVARRLGVSRQAVGSWRQRYADAGVDGLRERPRPGRPAVIDEAEVVARTLLGPSPGRSARSLARELGCSHAAVTSVWRRWRLSRDAYSATVVPTRPALPASQLWVLGMYVDSVRAVLLVGVRREAARSDRTRREWDDDGGTAFRDSVEGVVAAMDGLAATTSADDVPDLSPLANCLRSARREHPGVELHVVVLWDSGDGARLAKLCERVHVTHHLLPVRSSWRTFVRALIGIDSVRHPESSQRVYLDLTAVLKKSATDKGICWIRESVPLHVEESGGVLGGHREQRSGANQIDLGSFNECVVIEAVRLAGSTTRGEISRRTQLTQQAVSRIVRSLLSRGILVEDAHRHATAGKPRTPVRLREDAAHALGIHVDPEVLTAVVVDLRGSILRSRTEPITKNVPPEALVDQVARLGKDVLIDAGVDKETFLGTGVATPGPVDVESGTVLDPPLMSVWRDVPLLYLLKDRFAHQVVIEKDSSAAAVGERWIGRHRRARDFAYLYLGTGVGAGLFLNGNLYRGLSSNAGEFGQLCAIALGRFDAYGKPEILPECNPTESVPEIAARHGMAFRPDSRTSPGLAYQEVSKAVAAGNEVAADAVLLVARAIGTGALGLVDLLDIDLLVLGGPFFTNDVAEIYLTEIERVVNDYPTARRLRHVDVEPSVISREAAAVGAASVIFHATFTPRLYGPGG